MLIQMPRLTYSKRAAIRQAVEMQRLCFSNAQLLDQDIRASADKEQRARVATGLGNLVKAWRVLEDAKRVLKGDPMPGCLKPTERQPRKRRQPTPEEVAESMGLLAKQSTATEPDQPKNG
jgi:hypothetical protein